MRRTRAHSCGLPVFVYLAVVMLLAGTLTPGSAAENTRSFPLSDVRLLPGPAREAMERDRAYLRGLEVDRLLHVFRINAGIPSSALPLGGWEAPAVELRGHFVGHYLSACALMVASERDEVLRAKGDSVVTALAECQARLGGGYLSAYPESFIDRVETGQRVWAPWYTLHKIMAGLLDMYALAGNRQALQVLEKFVDWAKMRTDRLDDAAMQRMLRVEFGGMNDVLRNLYAVTGKSEHLALARLFDHAAVLDGLAAREDRLTGLHVNTQIPKIVGAAREYEISGDPRYRTIATYFWDQVVGARTYPTGGTSYEEHWTAGPNKLATHLGQSDHETCCTYNMMKLTRHLFRWSPEVRYADYYERALFNGILPVQNPEDGMTMYYVPMGSGWYKTFGSPRASFWCCTGTGVELFASLAEGGYYHDDSTLFVTMFLPTELFWREKNLRLRQETRFPDEEGTTITLEPATPVRFTLALRIPSWVQEGGSVTLNGKTLEAFARPSSMLTLTRLWKKGDRLTLRLPMGLRLSALPDNPNRVAVQYGPIVLAGDLGTEGLTAERASGEYAPTGDPVPVPHFVVGDTRPDAWITPVPGKSLTFRTRGARGRPEVTLVPFYRLFGARYALHWDVYTSVEWEGLARSSAAAPAGTFDRVVAGDSLSETTHGFEGFQIRRGEEAGRAWLATGDWIKFDLRVPAADPCRLACTYAVEDTGKAYAVHADGKLLVEVPSAGGTEGGMKTVIYDIPPVWSAGKKQVSVTFRINRGESSRKLFACEVLKIVP